MRYTFDASERLLYVYFVEAGTSVDQIELADDSVIDVDASGRVLGLEVISLERWEPSLVMERLGSDEAAYLRAVAHIFGPVIVAGPSDPTLGAGRLAPTLVEV